MHLQPELGCIACASGGALLGANMLTEIPASFSSKDAAQAALTDVRKTYRVALRGAVVIGPDYFGEFKIHAPIGGTGLSVGELAAVLRGERY